MRLKAIFALLLLFSAVLALSGCPGGTEQDQAIQKVDGTGFGKAIAWMASFFERGKNCNYDAFYAILEKQAGAAGAVGAEKEQLRPYFDSAKKCMPELKKTSEAADGKFKVTYSFEMPGTCEDEAILQQMTATGQFGTLDQYSATVDLATGEIEFPEVPSQGLLTPITTWDEYYAQVQGQMDSAMTQFEAQAGSAADAKVMLDCSMVGGFAMAIYVQDMLAEQIEIS